jgi:hypothetical protein
VYVDYNIYMTQIKYSRGDFCGEKDKRYIPVF